MSKSKNKQTMNLCSTFAPPVEKLPASFKVADDIVYEIPIYFTVLYNTAAQNAAISDAWLAEQLRVLNEDFSATNADKSEVVAQFQPVIGDAKFRFFLRGIRRVQTNTVAFPGFMSFFETAQGGIPCFDPLHNCNVYYAPFNWAGGVSILPRVGNVGQYYDGSVNRIESAMGGIDGLRICTHELGHWFNLYHTFQGGCAGNGDEVNDTPPCTQAIGCNLTQNTCGTIQNVQNHLDYSSCRLMFTKQQSERMRAALLFYRPQLISQGGNTPPTVAITSPASGSQFTAPANIILTATATDSDGTISKVEFFNGNTLLGSDTTLPYSFTWNNVPVGEYNITVKATDDDGAVSSSSIVVIVGSTVNNPPTCTVTGPANNSEFKPRDPVRITASASDSDGSVTKVEIYLDGSLLAPLLTPPYVLTLFPEIVKTYTIVAKAYDNQGATTTSAPVVFKVVANVPNTPPNVTLTSPANNATFVAPASIPLAATATDNVSVAKVEFYNGTTLLNTDTTAPYSFNWTNVQAGNYTLTAKAYDNQGATKTSSPISVTVSAEVQDSPVVSTILKASGAVEMTAADGRKKTIN